MDIITKENKISSIVRGPCMGGPTLGPLAAELVRVRNRLPPDEIFSEEQQRRPTGFRVTAESFWARPGAGGNAVSLSSPHVDDKQTRV